MSQARDEIIITLNTIYLVINDDFHTPWMISRFPSCGKHRLSRAASRQRLQGMLAALLVRLGLAFSTLHGSCEPFLGRVEVTLFYVIKAVPEYHPWPRYRWKDCLGKCRKTVFGVVLLATKTFASASHRRKEPKVSLGKTTSPPVSRPA